MLFNSAIFFLFFGIFYAGYLALYQIEKRIPEIGRRCRFIFLVTASAVFYGWWDWRFLFLILFTGSVDFVVSLLLHKIKAIWGRKMLLGTSLVCGIGTLSIFKYSGFFAEVLSKLVSCVGINYNFAGHIPSFCLILPVGISFYTFQSLSYTIDVYRGKLEPTRSYVHFFAYLMLFPQLVAGPIVRANSLLPQLAKLPNISPIMLFAGVKLVVLGFFKKCVLADNVAVYVNEGFANVAGVPDAFSWWLIMVLFSIQIYCDFSGYSDIARGLIKMMGYRFDLNFNHPELADSMKNFWQRWHISLSSWFRDYVYIPLGGSRSGRFPVLRGIFNMFITMLLSGLWHGAAWNFVFWGGFHGLALAVERVTGFDKFVRRGRWQHWMGIVVCQITVLLAWVFFRAGSFADAVAVFRTMFSFHFEKVRFLYKAREEIIALLLVFALIEFITVKHPEKQLRMKISFQMYRHLECVFLVILALAAIYFRGGGNVFIYFQF